eukprot:TRINITY_DN94498_c0_g1_i1.p1 TRINITY_DN94498_c0_g1~~TRINITY_DN94498_c0_g1_i1.p1  ORF type:complete len:432 (-),score=37.78 TRINITY_DN94498_c0_g1_i1:278-1573(-)
MHKKRNTPQPIPTDIEQPPTGMPSPTTHDNSPINMETCVAHYTMLVSQLSSLNGPLMLTPEQNEAVENFFNGLLHFTEIDLPINLLPKCITENEVAQLLLQTLRTAMNGIQRAVPSPPSGNTSLDTATVRPGSVIGPATPNNSAIEMTANLSTPTASGVVSPTGMASPMALLAPQQRTTATTTPVAAGQPSSSSSTSTNQPDGRRRARSFVGLSRQNNTHYVGVEVGGRRKTLDQALVSLTLDELLKVVQLLKKSAINRKKHTSTGDVHLLDGNGQNHQSARHHHGRPSFDHGSSSPSGPRCSEVGQSSSSSSQPQQWQQTETLLVEAQQRRQALLLYQPQFVDYDTFMYILVAFSLIYDQGQLVSLFQLIDYDCSGFVTSTKLLSLMDELGVHASATDINKLFCSMDWNGDGKVSLPEFVCFYKNALCLC